MQQAQRLKRRDGRCKERQKGYFYEKRILYYQYYILLQPQKCSNKINQFISLMSNSKYSSNFYVTLKSDMVSYMYIHMTLSGLPKKLHSSYAFLACTGIKLFLLYSFLWVILRRLNFMFRRFGTLFLIFIDRVNTNHEDGTDCSETSVHKIQTPHDLRRCNRLTSLTTSTIES